jgi:hypothetical protein
MIKDMDGTVIPGQSKSLAVAFMSEVMLQSLVRRGHFF